MHALRACSRKVRRESRKGTWWRAAGPRRCCSASSAITRPSVVRLALIAAASRSCAPTAPLARARSEPAHGVKTLGPAPRSRRSRRRRRPRRQARCAPAGERGAAAAKRRMPARERTGQV